ncbi:hypothetical protein RDI58_022129 [Solanum bulbocastanum]|uniref:Uncharacterized protein n=1 Tax=Solanum bulbocastanum TaxID=147425 RepID=A0AAN8T1H3_SOLBU
MWFSLNLTPTVDVM